MLITLDAFNQRIQHKKGESEVGPEQSEHNAFLLDGADGLSVALGFNEGMLSQADYLHINDNQFQIIEASDLRDQVATCENEITPRYEKAVANFSQDNPGKKIPKKLLKRIRNECYEPIKIELMQKWCGSIATSERLCRNQGITHNPKYTYVIVCRNGTDPQAMDYVKTKMSGAVGKLSIVTTDQIEL